MGVYWPRDRGAAIERLRGKQDIEDERMKKRLAFFLLALLLAVSAWAAAEEILYTGTVSKTMTIRAKKSTSASKLGSVEPGELLNIIEYGDTWTKVDQNGVRMDMDVRITSRRMGDCSAAENAAASAAPPDNEGEAR